VDNLHGVWRLAQDGNAMLTAEWGQLGQCVTQTVTPDQPWQDAVADQTALLLTDPAATDVGLIKPAGIGANGWDLLDFQWREHVHRTVRLPLDYDRNRHLWDEYVIDAAGVQLLTGKHLGHAHDLGDWTVDEVAPDRYLVRAKHLDPWYAGMVADPATVARARADFGDMILTWDAILAKPGPYSITEGIIVGR
jgi:hypothetical protein